MIRLAIVEDHASLIDGLKLLFANDDEIVVVTTARDGVELIQHLGKIKVNAILTDISMPRMNGVEVCRKVKEMDPSIKVVAFTMFDDNQAVRDMIDAGADGYLLKVRPLSKVREAIITVMNGERFMDGSITILPIQEINKNADEILSPSEREILKLIAAGHQSSEIAKMRHSAIGTVNKHRKNMIQKLGLQGKGELLRYALQKHGHYS